MSSDKYTCTLSDELKEKAEKELFETDQWRNRDIKALRERILNNKALTSRIDSKFLLMFLRARKFDYERTYKLLENYYKIRAEHAEHFKFLRPSLLTHILDAGIGQILPKPDPCGRKIFYFRPGRWNPETMSLYHVLMVNVMTLEVCLQDEATQIHGIITISNLDGVGWEQAKHANRDFFKLETSILQDGMPIRIKGINICNEPSVFTYIFSLFKPFLKEKLASRLHLYGSNLERLKIETGLTPDLLPSEIGGTLPHGDELAKEWKAKLMSYEQYFVDQPQYKIVLPRNISSTKSSSQEVNDIGGISGSFKKLSVD